MSVLFAGLGMMAVGCAPKSGAIAVPLNRRPSPIPPNNFDTRFEAGAEAASVITPSSASFSLPKATGGGNFVKRKSASASFVLSGGVIHAP